MKPIITYDDFAKLDLRVGKVLTCIRKEGSEKLLRLTVDFGEEGERVILSGIAKWYTPEDLISKEFIFVLNLQPRKIMDEESQGMILAAGNETPVLLTPNSETHPGDSIM
jgi:methionine--tRNA ligase beta chain